MGQFEYIEALSVRDTLLTNEYYYKYIFKKTEKIVCSVFYILNNAQDVKVNAAVAEEVRNSALAALAIVGDSLQNNQETVRTVLQPFSTKLILLESRLRILHAIGVLSTDHLNVFVSEIDSLLRSVRSYLPDTARQGGHIIQSRSQQETTGSSESISAQPSRTSGGNRRSRIIAVLQAQEEATIKDISDTVTDCSEKTIQRELNDMIKDGVVVRKGERRWSRYSLV